MGIPRDIKAKHVRDALRAIDNGETLDGVTLRPTTYVLVRKGRPYPPKPVIILAARAAGYRSVLTTSDFSGGNAPHQANGFLRRLGFEVINR